MMEEKNDEVEKVKKGRMKKWNCDLNCATLTVVLVCGACSRAPIICPMKKLLRWPTKSATCGHVRWSVNVCGLWRELVAKWEIANLAGDEWRRRRSRWPLLSQRTPQHTPRPTYLYLYPAPVVVKHQQTPPNDNTLTHSLIQTKVKETDFQPHEQNRASQKQQQQQCLWCGPR